METATNPNLQPQDVDTTSEALEQLRPVLNEALVADLFATRELYEKEGANAYALRYGHASKARKQGSKQDQSRLGLRLNGDPIHDVDEMRRYAVKESDIQAARAANADIAQVIVDQLGFEPGTDEFEAMRKPMFDLVTVSEDEWYGDEDTPGLRSLLESLGASNEDGSTENDESSSERDEPTEEEWDELRREHAEVLDTFTKQVAERSKRMIESARTTADIDASREELGDLINGIATGLMLELQGADGKNVAWADMSDDVRENIVQTVDLFVAEQTDNIISRMEEHRMADYQNSRPIMKKFYDKWAGWSQEKGLITKGKMKKAAVFAVPGAALGAALVPLAGVVGFGAVTGGLAVMGARSIGRRLAGAKLDAVANSERVATEQSDDIRRRSNRLDVSPEDILAIIDERTKEYRKQNRNRMAGGLAIALTVGLVTAKGADLLADNVDNWTFGKLGGSGDAPETGGSEPQNEPDMDGDGIPDATDTDRDGDGVRNGRDPAPNNPDISKNVTTRDKLFDGRLGTRELTPEGHEALAEQLNGYQVKSGDSVWSLSEQFLHEQGVQNPTVYEIDATKDILLKELQASGNVDSNGWLSTGDTISIK